jgi:anaphase-promoting complex subunit 4
VALQASSVVELLDVVQATLNVMHKQWHEAISVFEEKFQPLSVLLMEHGTQIKPRDELLNLLACGSASPGLHQFLASLGEAVMHLITW